MAVIEIDGGGADPRTQSVHVNRFPLTQGAAHTLILHLERTHILRALRQTAWRIAGARGAAELLGMKRTTLQARMRKLGIRRPI